MNFIVYDLEATCWNTESERRGKMQEVIEVGAVKINEEGTVVSRFESFVRPMVHPNLSDFCQHLTGISQIDVNQADTFPIVMEDFQEWIGAVDGEDYLLCSWGFFDKKILVKNSAHHQMESDWVQPHISLKHQYPRIKGIARAIGLRNALEREGFEFEGEHHRAIYDALNTVKLFLKFSNQWQF